MQCHYVDQNARWDEIETLHIEPNYSKRTFAEIVFIKIEDNCLNKITDLESFNESYNTILNSLW